MSVKPAAKISSNTPCDGHERRTKIDIIFEKVVSHVDAEIKQCPRCQARTKGRFPADMPGPLQYGPGVKAYVLNLLITQMVSLKRVQQSIMTLIGQVISEATLLKYVMQLHHCLQRWEESAIEQILAMPAMHVDETSFRVDRRNYWIHVCSAGEITCKFLHPKRGREAMDAIGVIPRYGGVVIHDCWASYLAYDHCGHGLCGSHLLRELTFVVDANGYAWAANMKRLLQETCVIVAKRKSKKLSRGEYKNLQKRYRNILTRGEKELPPIPWLAVLATMFRCAIPSSFSFMLRLSKFHAKRIRGESVCSSTGRVPAFMPSSLRSFSLILSRNMDLHLSRLG